MAEGLLGEPTSGRRRLAAACTRLLAPLDLRSLVLSGGGADSQSGAGGGAEREEACSASLGLASAVLKLLLLLPRAAPPPPHAAGGAGAAPPGGSAAPPGGGSACELLRLLSALLCTFCLSANLPTGSAGSHTLGSAVGRRLSAVLCRGLLPAALQLIRREAAAIKVGHLASNARLCAAAALSWSLSASVPLPALFEPAGPLGVGWQHAPSSSAAQPTAGAWAALRACQPQPADPRAVALLLRCTSRLLVDVDSEHDQAAAARLESVPVRLAGGFNLAAEAPCSVRRRLEQLFALPGLTLLDTTLGLLLACSLAAPAAEPQPPSPAATDRKSVV